MTDAGRYDDGVAGLHLMDWARRSAKLNLRPATCESHHFVPPPTSRISTSPGVSARPEGGEMMSP